MNKLLYHHVEYHNYSLEHGIAVLCLAVLCWTLIHFTKDKTRKVQRRTFMFLSLVPLSAIMIRMLIDQYLRGLNLQDDLPLHLCRILAVISPFFVFRDHQKALKIIVYLILAGTLNGLITADIEYGFPHNGYFVYWLYHGILVVMAIYAIAVFRMHLSLKDALHAFLAINIYFGLVHIVNLWVDANYMYSRGKPEVASLMDFLGPWPGYILWLELLAAVLLLLIHLVIRWVNPIRT